MTQMVFGGYFFMVENFHIFCNFAELIFAIERFAEDFAELIFAIEHFEQIFATLNFAILGKIAKINSAKFSSVKISSRENFCE